MLEHFQSLSLHPTAFASQLGFTRLPKSQTHIGLLTVSGTLPDNSAGWALRCQVQEALEVPVAAHLVLNGLILDVRALERVVAATGSLGPLPTKPGQTLWLVGPPPVYEPLHLQWPALVGFSAQPAAAFAEMKYLFRSARFDQGRLVPRRTQPDGALKLTPVTGEISALRGRYAEAQHKGQRVGWLQIVGGYGWGSAGAQDALYVRWQLRRVRTVRQPDWLLLDLTAFEYAWGDDLDFALNPRTLVIAAPEQRAALDYVVDEFFAPDLATALAQLRG